MRKISLLLLMMCAAGAALAQIEGGAYRHRLNQLNPYAYGVTATVNNKDISVDYKLNAPAVSSELVVYCDSIEVGTQALPATANTEGSHSASISLSDYTQGGTYTIGIRVLGDTTRNLPEQLIGIDEGDTVPTCYAFGCPKGVAIDKDPFSPTFGRILTNEGFYFSYPGYWSTAGHSGLYAFDAAFNPMYDGACFNGGLTYAETMTFGRNSYSPNRIKISKDGRIFVSLHDDRLNTVVYEVSQDLQTWTPLVTGDHTTAGVIYDANNNYVGSINCGMDVYGEGESLKIMTLGASQAAFPYTWNTNHVLAEYAIGTATSIALPTKADTLSKYFDAYIIPANCDVAYDAEGGFWYKGNRVYLSQSPLVHVTADGRVDFNCKTDQTLLCSISGVQAGGLNGGGGILVDGNKLYMGVKQTVPGTGHLVCLTANKLGDFTKLQFNWEINILGIEQELNAMDIDPAGNMYVVGHTGEKICALMLPKKEATVTPVNAEVVIEDIPTAIDHLGNAPSIEKTIVNGQLIITRDGVRYNAMGARL